MSDKKQKVICNNFDEAMLRCIRCPHRRPHNPIYKCAEDTTGCKRDLSVNIIVSTKCLPIKDR